VFGVLGSAFLDDLCPSDASAKLDLPLKPLDPDRLEPTR